MLKHNKKLAAAWKKKDKTKFKELMGKAIKDSIIKDAKEAGITLKQLEKFLWKVSKKK